MLHCEQRAPDFADSIQPVLQDINTQRVMLNPFYKVKTTQVERRLPAWVIWGAIGCVLALLLFVTFKLTVEVNKKAAGNHDDTGA